MDHPWPPEHKHDSAVHSSTVLSVGLTEPVQHFGLNIPTTTTCSSYPGCSGRGSGSCRSGQAKAPPRQGTTPHSPYPGRGGRGSGSCRSGARRQQQGQLGDAGEREVRTPVYPGLKPRLNVHRRDAKPQEPAAQTSHSQHYCLYCETTLL